MLPKSSPAVSGQRAQRPAPVGHAALIQPRLVAQQANLVQSACIARNAAPAFARGRPRAERRPESGAARSVPANIVAASYEEPFSPQDQTACPLRSEADRLTQLLKRLKACKSQDAKLKALLQEPCVLAHKDSAG